MTITVTALIAWGRGYKWDRVDFNEFDFMLTRFDMCLFILTLFETLACSTFQERVFSKLCERLRQARHLSASGGEGFETKTNGNKGSRNKKRKWEITVLELSW